MNAENGEDEAAGRPGFAVRLKEVVKAWLNRRRPWTELIGTGLDSFSRPRSLCEAFHRSRHNINNFRGNYASIVLVTALYSLLGDPTSLAVMFALAVLWHYLFFFRSGNPSLLGLSVPEGFVLVVLSLITLAAVFVTNIEWSLFSSARVGAVIVAIHAVFRDPYDLFADEAIAARLGIVAGANV